MHTVIPMAISFLSGGGGACTAVCEVNTHEYTGSCACACPWWIESRLSGIYLYHFPPYCLSINQKSIMVMILTASSWNLPLCRSSKCMELGPVFHKDAGVLNSGPGFKCKCCYPKPSPQQSLWMFSCCFLFVHCISIDHMISMGSGTIPFMLTAYTQTLVQGLMHTRQPRNKQVSFIQFERCPRLIVMHSQDSYITGSSMWWHFKVQLLGCVWGLHNVISYLRKRYKRMVSPTQRWGCSKQTTSYKWGGKI